MSRRKYRPEYAGDDGWSDWVHPLPGYRWTCCDCSLVHELELTMDAAGKLCFRMRRNNRSTAALRRSHTQGDAP